jgi:hypothetical protein
MVLRVISRGLFAPQGRLTLTTATPVLTSDVTGALTVFYALYNGDKVPLYSGSEYLTYEFAELSCLLSDATKSPAAAAADSLYDMFIWNDAGTMRLTRGPVWTDATTRSAGTALVRTKGAWLNSLAITNGPGASLGTYVGTIATNAGAATVNMQFLPAAASGGNAPYLGVWNAYNRVPTSCVNLDSDDTWDYTTATLRPMNNDQGGAGVNTDNRITFVSGLEEGRLSARAVVKARNTNTGVTVVNGIGLDSTSALASGCFPGRAETTLANAYVTLASSLQRPGSLGRRFVQALEYSAATGTTTWGGDVGDAALNRSGISVEIDM